MSNKISFFRLDKLNPAQYEKLLIRNELNAAKFIKAARPIIENVRKNGDKALCQYAKKFNGAILQPRQLFATPQEIKQAYKKLDPEFIKVLKFSATNIRKFHQRQMPKNWNMEIQKGVHVGMRFTPIDSVACYAPRGKGSFPSVTLMSVIPAKVAGVKNIIVLTPPLANGEIDPATLVAADIAGCNKIYKVGGAQAVAAAAFGTPTIPKCLKIEGPGSMWVVAAKQLLQNEIDIGMPAGPSESIVFADSSANARLVALDTIIESEHGEDSSVFLLTTSEKIAHAAQKYIFEFWQKMRTQNRKFSQTVLGGKNGGIVLARNLRQAYDFINSYAPEHLQIMSKKPRQHLTQIKNAAEILLGENTPSSVANYMMGPNCILPTSGHAKTFSPLSVQNFLKSNSVGKMTKQGLKLMAPKTKLFAEYEGFDAHANAVSDLRNPNCRRRSRRRGNYSCR